VERAEDGWTKEAQDLQLQLEQAQQEAMHREGGGEAKHKIMGKAITMKISRNCWKC
jgi:hypothetical protein